jgi:hypothetical protein
MSLKKKTRPELIKDLCSVIQRQDLELNRLIDAQNNRLAIRHTRIPRRLPLNIQHILFPPLLPPFHFLAGLHIDEVPMPWQGKLPIVTAHVVRHPQRSVELHRLARLQGEEESVVNAAEHEAVGHALYGQAAHLQRLRSVAVETLEIPTQLRKARV